jgi:hypothetical protein
LRIAKAARSLSVNGEVTLSRLERLKRRENTFWRIDENYFYSRFPERRNLYVAG